MKKNFLSVLLCVIMCAFVHGASEQEMFDGYLSAGINAFQTGKLTEAAVCFDKCSKIDPHNHLPWYWGGMVHIINFDKSIQLLDYAIKIAPHEPDPYAIRGWFKIRRASSPVDILYVQGMADITQALNIDSRNIPANYHLATEVLMRNKQYDKAIVHLNEVLRHTSENTGEATFKQYPQDYIILAYLDVSECYANVQAFDNALKNINMCIERHLKSGKMSSSFLADAYQIRFEAHKRINKQSAINDIDVIITHAPALRHVMTYEKIDLLLDIDDKQKATDLCRKMLQLSSSNDTSRLLYIYCLGFKCEQMEEAAQFIDLFDEEKLRKDHELGIVTKNEMLSFYEVRCFLNIVRGRFEEASQDISSKIALKSIIARDYLVRAKILLIMGKSEDAQSDINTYLRLYNPVIVRPCTCPTTVPCTCPRYLEDATIDTTGGENGSE